MLSYRHAFHAGNHADILEHYIFSLVLDYFNQKDKPYCVIDTHAGAGIYNLDSTFSQKNSEFDSGIARLFSAQDAPNSLATFIDMVQSFNQDENLKAYPGSPKIAEYFLRAHDKLRLFELHTSDHQLLTENFKNKSHQTKIEMQDGFIGIKSCLPPHTKRGIVMIDPPYEDKYDYERVVSTIKGSLKRFATGTYIIWYPLLQRSEPLQMVGALKQLNEKNWLNMSLNVGQPSTEGFGMFGSGLFIINPPWVLPKTLEATLPYLSNLLRQDDGASYTLESEIP